LLHLQNMLSGSCNLRSDRIGTKKTGTKMEGRFRHSDLDSVLATQSFP
jgi:hypothetical protein